MKFRTSWTPVVASLIIATATMIAIGLAETKTPPAAVTKDLAAQTPPDSLKSSPPKAAEDKVLVTYFHGNRRCATCLKLEAYSHEAIELGFADRLKDSTLVWRLINFDEEGNGHYLKDYDLFGQALLLSRVRDGKEIKWKNLEKIWELVRDKEAFIAYVQNETKLFLEGEKK